MIKVEGKQFEIAAVVAMARNRVIGLGGGMPWRLPSDLKHYRRLTMGRPMIMGRKTLDAIGKALDGRDTIVLTRSPASVRLDGVIAATSAPDALTAAARCAAAREANEIVIAGGAEIFQLFLEQTDRLEVTCIDAEPAGDTVFPAIDERIWRRAREEAMRRTDKDSANARFVTFERREKAAALVL